MNIGIHGAHELYSPSELLRRFCEAGTAGISHGMCSDHFHPWSERQAASGFAWSWLPAALQATHMTLGTVCAPGQRYHPAIIAQAMATLGEMFPGRIWLAVGSGEFLNESITGEVWPLKIDRNHRLLRAVEIMRALWRGERVSHHGAVNVQEAKLYTLPQPLPAVFGAAITPETAGWVGDWADGLITCGHNIEDLRLLINSFRDVGGSDRPVKVQLAVSYAPSRDSAIHAVHRRWRHCGLPLEDLARLPTPRAFDIASEHLTLADIDGKVFCTDSLAEIEDLLNHVAALGVSDVYLNDLSDDVSVLMDFIAQQNQMG